MSMRMRSVSAAGLAFVLVGLASLISSSVSSGALPDRASPRVVPSAPTSSYTQFASVSCVYADLCFAAGTAERPSGPSMTRALMDYLYQPGSWVPPNFYPFPTGAIGTAAFSISCIETGSSAFFCMEVGEALYANHTTKEYVLHFTGVDHHGSPPTIVGPVRSVLTAFQPSNWNPVLDGVFCRFVNYCIAVGGDYATPAPNLSPKLAIATIFDGTSWIPSNPPVSPITGSTGAVLYGVSCVATLGVNGCMAVGATFHNAKPLEALSYAHSTTWRLISNAAAHASTDGGALFGVSCAPSTPKSYCVAVGGYDRVGFGEFAMGALWPLGHTKWNTMYVPPQAPPDAYYGVDCKPSGACTAVGSLNATPLSTDVYPPTNWLSSCPNGQTTPIELMGAGGTNAWTSGIPTGHALPIIISDLQFSAVSVDWPGGIGVGVATHWTSGATPLSTRCTATTNPLALVP